MSLLEKIKEKYYDKKVLIVGLGLQGGGLGLAKFFADLGAKVTVTDKKDENQLKSSIEQLKDYPITYHLGGHELNDFLSADFIFKGPSVPWSLPEIIEAQKKNIPIEMEMSFVVKNFPGIVIGITGTRGKSTTTNLIYTILKKTGFNVLLGGGLPGISNIEYLKKADQSTYLVAELSSWALSGFHRQKISPQISVFTSFYPDHLNYYKNMNDYFYDKAAIFLYQKQENYLIANKKLKTLIEKYSFKSKTIYFTSEDFPEKLKYLKGVHNLENAAAALQVAKVLKIDLKKAIDIIVNFSGLVYRQEIIKEKDRVIFVNDTTSTTPVATIKALEAFSDKPIYLIMGGNSKNLPFDELIEKLVSVEKIILLSGSFTDEILSLLKKKYPDKLVGPFDDLEKAVKTAFQLAKTTGGYLLFSPAATSFAMFNNEFHRGMEFNKIVKKI